MNPMPKESASNVDIFNLLGAEEKENKKRREELLAACGVEDLFKEGKITINKHTCLGVQCKLCIKACPTNALYWKTGEIGITKELCVFCGACVLSCMVENCMKVERKRENGKTEKFSNTRDVVILENDINSKKRFERVKEVLPDAEAYCKRYKTES
jgi:NAD-dependent dihydropyrimidine dehydrogenase PreA subunit